MKETAIVFSSDHGGTLKGHGGMTMLEMQTPLVVYGDKLPKNFHMTYSVMRYNTVPTIIELLLLKATDAWRGKSVLRQIK